MYHNHTEQTRGNPSRIHVGIDVGSTTTKICVLAPRDHDVLFSRYIRHNARQAQSVVAILTELDKRFPTSSLRVALCGSGGKSIADALDLPYIQEVVANSLSVRTLHSATRCAIELGGQDAKMIFFRPDENTHKLAVSDMRMNGSCAGGTGAFIDEIAALLKIPVEHFDDLARQGKTIYDISGRCGVYAKTDIQPLLNQGVPKADIALSAFHAIAKQTIGGLAQGITIKAPVIFEGGPLTFNPTLVRVFTERLMLTPEQTIIPAHPETIVAYGAALSLSDLFAQTSAGIDISRARACLAKMAGTKPAADAKRFFATEDERIAFERRHALPPLVSRKASSNPKRIRAYLGIDSGSTTTKFALIDEDKHLVDEFYAVNEGEPLEVLKNALGEMNGRYRKRGIQLDIIAVGTTGYGELLLHKALHADFHTVETVAHATAATEYLPETSFILDIGGQDMKAIWVDEGIISDIVVNEACSSGCGSFLESFASSLGIPVENIADAAFRSENPASLGSRCTVFMNSSIVTEQRNGKKPDDIMAGLCRSIVENVFTKVIRIANLDDLGDFIVVQGGTFKNDAVLRALEQYLGKEVTRAPYPGLMGAIGVALLTKRHVEATQREVGRGTRTFTTNFIGFDALRDLSITQGADEVCSFCANHCTRHLMTFSDGDTWITGNRCPKGEIIGDPRGEEQRERLRAITATEQRIPNLFAERERLLFKDYPYRKLIEEQNITIGLPRVLSFWDTMPFWTTFFRTLGFSVRLSRPSTRAMFERGLASVTSDTICFPAKLVHGHLRDLVDQKVDRIFMPVITTVESENTEQTSESMCAVVKGYPLVIRNSDNPEEYGDVVFDDPLFHWYDERDRETQIIRYMEETFQIDANTTREALLQADRAQDSFRTTLIQRGNTVREEARKNGTYAVVLASRPYHNDPLINHDLATLFTDRGIAVLTPDAVDDINEVDLSCSRLDIVNNFHARMLSAALIAARDPHLEYAQIVSFGCGHDAYLSDEIVRLMKEVSGKTPLILKVDESDARGPLRIRVRSFVETIGMKRERRKQTTTSEPHREPDDPYPVKYDKRDRHEKIVLVPNTSHAFCRLMSAAFVKQGIRAEPLDVGREEAIRLGKKYVHNDICFPAQMTIGEALAALESGTYDDKEVAIGTGKYLGDCRLTHYGALLRKALDDAGYAHVPIITNDDVDSHNLHPGFKLSTLSAARIALVLPMIDALEELLRKIRPYEAHSGDTDRAFERALDEVIEGLEKHGVHGAVRGFKRAIGEMNSVDYDRSHPKPSVLIVGEYLLNFHPGANHDIESYLEDNGLEIIEARMSDVIRKTYFYKDAQIREFGIAKPPAEKMWYRVANRLFEIAHDITDHLAAKHPLYTPVCRMPELVRESDPVIHHTFDAGEGVLIPAEILHHGKHGCRSFIILQPFGCLPNHVCGRGVVKKLKEIYPDAHILSLDYDPDVSFANIENRLQMLIMNAHDKDREPFTDPIPYHDIMNDAQAASMKRKPSPHVA